MGASAMSLDITGGAGMTFNSQNAFKSVRKSQRFQYENSQKKSVDNGNTPSVLSAYADHDKFANIRTLYAEQTAKQETEKN